MAVSEFQLALIGAGAVAVLGVWSYNTWQDYRQRKTAEKIFRGDQKDILVGDALGNEDDTPTFSRSGPPEQQEAEARVEPRIELRTEPRPGPRVEPVIGSQGDVLDAVPDAPVVAQDTGLMIESPDEELLDPMIEVAMAFPPRQGVAVLQAAWRETNKVDFGKRIRWVGRGSGNGEWAELGEDVSANADHVHIAIQLADRQGVIDANELRVFCHTAEAVAAAHGGDVNMPAFDEVMAHARAIDDLCASVDIQIAIHIVSRSGQEFSGSKLRGMLEAAGLLLAADGLFYLLDADGKRLLSVCNSGAVPFNMEQMRTGTTADITFWLDVPRVADGGHVFDTMVATARQLAEALDGVLVDDQRNPLADNVLSGIRDKVVELQAQMAAHGISAGGRRALRLFA